MSKDDLKPLAVRLVLAKQRAEAAVARFQHLEADFQECVAEHAKACGVDPSTPFDVDTLEFAK